MLVNIFARAASFLHKVIKSAHQKQEIEIYACAKATKMWYLMTFRRWPRKGTLQEGPEHD